MFPRLRSRTLINRLSWAAVIWVVVFWRLGYLSLLDPDEAHYAQLTREMIHARQWFVPLLNGVPFIDKPVLYHWLQAAAQAMLGETEFALRLPSALAAVAMIAAVRWAGRSLAGAAVGRRAALMFASTPLTFALASIGVFDMVYTAFLFGAVACLLVAATTGRRTTETAGWILLTLAVLTKGPVALLLVATFGLLLAAVPGTRPAVRALHWPAGLLGVALASAPWFVYMAVVYGDLFVRDYLLAGNLWYFTRPAQFSTRHSDSWFYARTYLGACFPWSVLALAAGVDAWWSRRRLEPAERVLWIWVALVLGFFSAAGFKLDTYVFPAAPATALLVAMRWQRLAEEHAHRVTSFVAACVAAVLVGGGAVLATTMFRIDLGVSAAAALLPAALMAGGLAAGVVLHRRGLAPLPTVLVITLVTVYGVVVVEGFPVLERSRPTAPIGRWISRHAPADEPVGVYGLDDWRASLRFYTRHQLVVLHDGAEIQRFFDAHPNGYVVMLRRDAAGFESAGVPLRRVGGRRAIVGRSGKFIRRQRWDRIVVTASPETQMLADGELEPGEP